MAIVTMGPVVLDCPDPKALAEFYAAVLGWKVDGEGSWVEAHGPDGQVLAFQEAADMVPPQWPSGEHSQQLHLDLMVDREHQEDAERQVLALGARLLQGDDGGKRAFRVYQDPAGHPFCLCV